MKRAVLLLTWSLLCYGCGKCEKLNLAADTRSWVNHFSVGEKAIFSSLNNLKDTLVVTDKRDYYTVCNKIEVSKYQYEIFDIQFQVKSINAYNGAECNIRVTTQELKKPIPYIYLGNLGPHRNDLENELPKATDTSIGGIELKSVYQYKAGINTEEYGENKYFASFFWSKDKGLVAYQTIDGQVFIRSGLQ